MEIILSGNVQVHSNQDGTNWTIVETSTIEKEDGTQREIQRNVGHYGRMDQAISRALDVCVFDRAIDRIYAAALAKRITDAKEQILEAVRAVDEVSMRAATKEREARAKKMLANTESIRKADLRNAERAMAGGTSIASGVQVTRKPTAKSRGPRFGSQSKRSR